MHPHALMDTPTTPAPAQETPQQRFARLYITSAEICRALGVSRPAVMDAAKRGLLPAPIVISSTSPHVWERDTVAPALDAWRIMLGARRKHHSA